MNLYEKLYEKNKLNTVISVDLNINNIGNAKLQLVPSKYSFFKNVPTVIIINEKNIVPLNPSWTILISLFLVEVKKYKGKIISEEELENSIDRTIKRTRKIYHFVGKNTLKTDLLNIINLLINIANNKNIDTKIKEFNVNKFVMNMRAPYSLNISIKNGGDEKEEIITKRCKTIINICRKNCIPKLVFTLEEPSLKDVLVELIEYSEDFTMYLKTNGLLIPNQYYDKFYNAKVDNICFTLYSNEAEIHNKLAKDNSFDDVVQGIKNAISAKLDVAVYTPICKINKNYLDTLNFIKDLGIRKVILGKYESDYKLSKKEYTSTLKKIEKFSAEENIELEIEKEPTILSDITVLTDGEVISGNTRLGNILNKSFEKIWNCDEALMLKYSLLNGVINNEN